MRMRFLPAAIYFALGDVPANNLDIFRTDIAANEVMYQMYENGVLLNLVHRDFGEEIKNHGDSVSIKRPANLRPMRKSQTDSIVMQELSGDKITVKLDQHVYTSFMVADEDMSKTRESLTDIYLIPAARALVTGAERMISGRMAQLSSTVGTLGAGMNDSLLLSAGTILDNKSVPGDMRTAWVTPNMYASFLNVDKFVKANESGDGGRALQLAQLGYRSGFNFVKSVNLPSITTAYTNPVATTTSAAAAAGATTIAVTSATNIKVSGFITIATELQPFVVIGLSGTDVTLDRPLRNAVASGAAVNPISTGTVNKVGGYAAGYRKDIEFDGFSGNAPAEKAVVAIGGSIYTVIARDATSMLLDRPLDAAVADNAVIGAAPAGEYGFAGIPQAIGFVCRPLATVGNQQGVVQRIISDPSTGLSIRSTVGYNMLAQGTMVTLDMLCGSVLFNDDCGVRLIG